MFFDKKSLSEKSKVNLLFSYNGVSLKHKNLLFNAKSFCLKNLTATFRPSSSSQYKNVPFSNFALL